MTRTGTNRSAQERLAGRCSSTRIPKPHTADAVTVTEGTSVHGTSVERFLTVGEATALLRLSQSWLAKARMRGDGPPYVKIGRAIRYSEGALLQWLKSNTRLSTRER
jgi:predicted DNA-binding transcriptional regulator AlpA